MSGRSSRTRIAARGAALLTAALCLLLAACASSPWKAPGLRDHPLVGRIWDVRAGAFIDEPTLLARLREPQIVLLGETHDNPDHHRLQLRVLEAIVAAGRRPALAMEQFDIERQRDINKAVLEPGRTADRVADAGGLDRRGWDWDLYEPLVAAALRADLPIVAANISRAELRKVAADGFGVLGPGRAERLGIETVWNDSRQSILREVIVQGHCGYVPPDLLPRLLRSQRTRDAVMAEAVADWSGRGVVGILGRGHVRADIGVPIYLAHIAPRASLTTVGMVEVAQDVTSPAAYLARDEGGRHDYLWFTPRAVRKDPCEGFSLRKSEGK